MIQRETLKTRQEAYAGTFLTVYRDAVVLPDGREATREWLAHPGSAAVVPLLAGGDVLLIRQFRYATGRTYLEVPAGKLDAGESPEAAAQRELGEETGYRAGRLTPLGQTHPCIGYSNETIALFLGERLEVEARRDGDEAVEPVRMPFAEAVRRARAGALLDAKTTVALLRAAAFLEGRGAGRRRTEDGGP